MDLFRADGHLTDEALAALIRDDGALGQLERLELAEHLSFCDLCLQRYTDLLTGTELLTPERSCQRTLWVRVRRRAVQLVTSRYATAAAAVALALTVLWGGQEITFSRPAPPEARPRLAERLQGWPERWNDALSETLSGVTDFFDGLRPENNSRGGVHS